METCMWTTHIEKFDRYFFCRVCVWHCYCCYCGICIHRSWFHILFCCCFCYSQFSCSFSANIFRNAVFYCAKKCLLLTTASVNSFLQAPEWWLAQREGGWCLTFCIILVIVIRINVWWLVDTGTLAFSIIFKHENMNETSRHNIDNSKFIQRFNLWTCGI